MKKQYKVNPLFIKIVNTLVNTLINTLSIFIKKDKNIILIGSFFNGFTDNAKYMYLYLLENYKDKKVVWITDNHELIEELKAKDYSVQYKWSLETFLLVLKAEFIFITHNIKDVFPWIRKDTTVVNLWHGFGLKKMGYDSKTEVKWLKRREKFKLSSPYSRWNYITLQTPLHIPFYKSSMKLKEENFLISGVPKNDILFDYKNTPSKYSDITEKIKKEYNLYNKKIILYAPTWRDDPKDKTLINLIKNEKFVKFLENNNYLLLLKWHPGAILDLDSSLSTSIINVSSYSDIQELYLVSDILISDYSSVIFDFSILERAIILYAYDLEKYEFIRGGFYFDYYDIFKEFAICKNETELIEKINLYEQFKSQKFYKKYNIENASFNILTYLEIDA